MKKENKIKDELDVLLESMKAENSMPDKDFEEDLRYEILKKSGKKFTQSKGLFGIKWNFGLAVVALLFLATGIIGVQTVSYIFGDRPSTAIVLSSNEKEEFLTNVIDNNSQEILSTNFEAVQATSDTDGGGVVLPVTSPSDNVITSAEVEKQKDLAISAEKSYSFSKTTTTFYDGPAAGQCDVYTDSEEMTVESSEYVDKETGTYYFKYTSYDSEGNLINYYLDDQDGYLSYFGGSYAVKELKEPVVEETPTETPEEATDDAQDQPISSEELVETYFSNAKVEKTGESYTITYENELNCGSEENPELRTVFYVSKVDGDSFSLSEHNTYIDEVSDENLLSGYKYVAANEDKTLEEISEMFTFDYEVEVRDIGEYTLTYLERHEDLMNYLKTNKVKLLTSQEAGLDLTYLTYYDLDTLEKNYSYLIDREFYPEGESGDERYQFLKDETDTAKESPNRYSVYYGLTDPDGLKAYYFTYYSEDLDDEAILGEMGLSSLDSTNTFEKISINGSEVEINLYTFPDNGAGYSIFEFGGYKVLMAAYPPFDASEFDLFLDDLDVLDMSKTLDFNKVDQKFKAYIEGYEDDIYHWGD